MQQSGSGYETFALVLIALGCICTVFGTFAMAFRVTGGGRLTAAGVLLLAAGGVVIMDAGRPA